MNTDELGITEQLPLFADKQVLLNRGIWELTRLNLVEANQAFESYAAIHRGRDEVDAKKKLTEFLMQGFASAPGTCPEDPAYLCGLWSSFEDYAESIGCQGGNIISEIKASFFSKVVEAVARCNLTEEPYLSDNLPTGYVYIQAGKYDLAIKALQACIPTRPDNAAIYGYLGDAYVLRGETDVARQCYQEACLIDPSSIHWPHVKDNALLELRKQLIDDYGLNAALASEWLPSHAYLQGLFKPKKMQLNQGIKEFVKEYLDLKKAFSKRQTSDLKAKLFFRSIILCDNEPLLRFVKRINFIEVRRQMKGMNPSLFSTYLKVIEGKK